MKKHNLSHQNHEYTTYCPGGRKRATLLVHNLITTRPRLHEPKGDLNTSQCFTSFIPNRYSIIFIYLVLQRIAFGSHVVAGVQDSSFALEIKLGRTGVIWVGI